MAGSRTRRPRILVLRFGYFLEREILAALGAMDVDLAVVAPRTEEERRPEGFAAGLTAAVASFRPHFTFSVNGLGADPSGRMAGVLGRTGTRMATWFVDSPELFLHGVGPEERQAGGGLSGCAVLPERNVSFCCDPDHAAKFAALGLSGSHLLPLACDHTRFDLAAPLPRVPGPQEEVLDLSFIGTTWVDKLAACHKNFRFPAAVLRGFQAVARDLAGRPAPVVAAFCAERHPGFWTACRDLDPDVRRGVLHLVCWEANRTYRLACVRAMLAAAPGQAQADLPLVAGDRHWPRLLRAEAGRFVHHPPIGYYGRDLARFYRLARVNFCCSGIQMPRAVTQRAFDVPAAGGFALFDARDQLAECFEMGREAVCYRSMEEIPELVGRYARDREAARGIVEAARRRILAEHTYRHRMERVTRVMQGT